MENTRTLTLLKYLELVIGGTLMVMHSKSEFLIPSLGYGTYSEVVIAMSGFSMMIVPLAFRFQASLMCPSSLSGVVDVFIPTVAVWAYAMGGIVTLYGWTRTRTKQRVFFRNNFDYLLLGKGMFSLLLTLLLCLDVGYTLVKTWKDTYQMKTLRSTQ